MQGLIRTKRTVTYAAIALALCIPARTTTLHSRPADQPRRPHITAIDYVRIYVSDANKSRQFYSNIFGLTIGCRQYRPREACLLVGPAEQRLLLQRAPTGAENSTLKNWLAEIAFATDDLVQMRRYLLAHGRLPGTIHQDPDGAQCFRVRDPEGNSIAFVHRSPSKSGYRAAPMQISTHLIHAGFVVNDMAAENRFYVNLLGFRLYWYGGFKDDSIDWYELQVPDGSDWIEYMLNVPPNADHKELGVQNHLSFGVKDVHAATRQLRFNGLHTFDGPEIGRDGKDSVDVYDPDGTRIEIMEFVPTQKPCCHPYTADHPKL